MQIDDIEVKLQQLSLIENFYEKYLKVNELMSSLKECQYIHNYRIMSLDPVEVQIFSASDTLVPIVLKYPDNQEIIDENA